MTPTLADQIKQIAAFDEALYLYVGNHWRQGALAESARLHDLHQALCAAVEALETFANHNAREGAGVIERAVVEAYQMGSREALAKIEAEVRRMKGGE